MKLTREQALNFHRQMWSDMQKDLGDNAKGLERVEYKEIWCRKHFPDEDIHADCFLCEYASKFGKGWGCKVCPIVWKNEDIILPPYCTFDFYYYNAPISEILALPERELRKDN